MVVDQSSSPLGAAVGHDATLPSDLIAAKPPVFSYSGLTRVVTSDATSAEPMLAPLAEFPHATTLPSFFTAAIADLVLKISLTQHVKEEAAEPRSPPKEVCPQATTLPSALTAAKA